MAEFADSAVGTEDQNAASGLLVEAEDGGSVSLPDGFDISSANFETDGSNLLLTGADGTQVTVEGFFAQENPPELVSSDGAQISGDMATQLAGGPGDESVSAGTDSDGSTGTGGMIADNPSVITGTDGEPIGNVENMTGSVFAIRTDGERVELKEGDPVYQGDIIESSDDGAIGILLADETTFSMGENGRIVLDEMIYDPATQEGSVGLSILQGVFTFVSGQVAKTDPDAMTLDTPVATIGIRGTQVGIDVDPEGGGMNVVLMEEADGFVGEVVIANAAGVQVMNGANQTTSVANFSTAPTEIRVMDIKELLQSFGAALKQLPKVHGNQNDFGLQDGEAGEGEDEEEEEEVLDEEVEELEEGEESAEDLEDFDTAAGEEEEEGEGEGEGEGDDLAEAEADAEAEAEADAAEEALEAASELAAEQAAAALAAAQEAAATAAAEAASEAAAAAAKAAAAAAARAAAEAALRSAQAAAGGEARNAAAQADKFAVDARKFADNAQKHADDAEGLVPDVSDSLLASVSPALVDAVSVMNGFLADLNELAIEADAAADLAEAAAEAANDAADSATGGGAFAGRDAARGEQQEANDQLVIAEGHSSVSDDHWGDLLVAVNNVEQLAFQEALETATLAEAAAETARDSAIDARVLTDKAAEAEGNALTTGQFAVGAAWDTARTNLENSLADLEQLAKNVADAAGAAGDAAVAAGIAAQGAGVDASAARQLLALFAVQSGAELKLADAIESGDVDAIAAAQTALDAATAAFREALATASSGTALDDLEAALVALGDATTALATAETNLDAAVDLSEQLLADVDDALQVIADSDWQGTDGDDVMDVTSVGDGIIDNADQVMDGGTGNDFINAGAGDDILIGGTGDDVLIGGDGNDILIGGDLSIGIQDLENHTLKVDDLGNIFLVDVNGIETQVEQGAFDTGADVLDGGDGDDILFGGGGDDTLTGGAGDDILIGGTGTDTVIIAGNSGDFTIETDPVTGAITVTAPTIDGIAGDVDILIGVEFLQFDDQTIDLTNPDDVADAPTLDLDLTQDGDQLVGVTAGDEDNAIQLDISADLTDPTEKLSIRISGIPLGAVLILADGTELTPIDGEVTLTQEQLTDLSIRPPENDDSNFNLTVTATSTTASGDEASTTGDITVTVDAVADAPTLDVTVTQGVPGGTIPLVISDEQAAEDPTPDDSSVHQIIGTDGDDILEGQKREEFIDGGAGNDIITGSGGADVIVGGEGDDYIEGGEGADDIFGGTGDDILKGGKGSDEIYGGAGNDFIEGGEGADILSGGAGDDFIDGGRFHEGGEGGGHYHDGSQSDTVLFTGSRDQYMITLNADGTFTVVDMFAGRDGTDTVINVENFQFSDGTITEEDLVSTNPTTFIVDIDSSLTDVDGSESLSFTVTGLPDGAWLTFGTEDPPGTWTFTAEDFATFEAAGGVLGVVVPYDVQADFQLSVTATSSEENNDSTASTTVISPVDGDAAPPELNVVDVTGDEDTAIALNLSAALVDTDGSETLAITIDGVPEGAVLASGGVALVANADGSYTLTTSQLTGLTITPPADSSDDFQLTVTATSSEAVDGTASTTGVINVIVDGVSDGATLDLNPDVDGDQSVGTASGDEDTAIALDISAAVADVSESMTITISGVPTGAVLSAGTDNQDGTWTLTADQLENLTITPAPDSDEDFTLTVTVTTTDEGDTATTTGTIDVSVAPDADAPTLDLNASVDGDQSVGTASGDEDTAIALDISAAVTDASESMSITISGVPTGSVLSAGTDNLDGTWTLSADQLANLTITPPINFSGNFDLSVTATSTDGTDTATTSGTISVSVTGSADAPALDLDSAADGEQLVGAVSGTEDMAIALDISAALTDASEELGITITINGFPPGATLSAGTLNPDGSYSLTADQLSNLTVTPPPDSDADFTLAVTVTSTDGTDTATTSGVINVSVDPDADAPTLTITDASGAEDTAIALDITSALTDTDGSETLSVTIAGVPAGAVLSAGTPATNPDGTTTWTLTPEQLSGLTITPPADSDADFSLSVTATSTDGTDTATTSGTINVSVDPDADAPTLSATDVTGAEDTAIALNISSAVTDASETLSVSVAGIPAGSVVALADGTAVAANGDGSYTLTPDQLSGLTLTPPQDFSGTINLSVTSTSTDGTSTATATDAFTVTVEGVADAPTLDVSGVTGAEDGAIALNIAAGLTDSSETLSVSIGGVPAGAVLTAADGTVLTANADGSYTVDGGQIDGLTMTPPDDFSGDIPLTVTATSVDGTSTASSGESTFTVTVTGVADAPTLDLNASVDGDQSTATATGTAGEAIALDISAGLTDASETLSISIGGIPTDAFLTLADGTKVSPDADGNVTLSPNQLSGLTLTPSATFSGSIALAVIAIALDGTSQALASGTIDITVDPVVESDTTADGVTLTVDGTAPGFEDTAIALNISADLIDTDGSESVSITISGVPEGAVLSAGTEDPDNPGTWTLDSGDLTDLTITPPEDSNVDFDLTVTTTTTESDGGATATSEATITVDVTGVADAPTVFASIGNEVSYQDVVLEHEPIAYFRMNEGEGNTVVDSVGNHTGTYKKGAESETDVGGIGSGAGDFDGRDDRIEIPHSSDMELSSGSITVWFNSDHVNDKQGLFSMDSKGSHEGDLTAFVDDGIVKIRMQDADGNSHWIEGGTLADNTWSQVTFNWGPDGMELYVDGQLVDTNDYTGGIENNDEPLVIGANSWSSDDGDANHLKDYFDGQIDEFSIMGEPLTAAEVTNLYNTGGQSIIDNGGSVSGTVTAGHTFELQIAGTLADTDSSETLTIVVSGVPSGAILSAGVEGPAGTWTLLDSELSGLTLITDETVTEDFDLSITAVATEDDGDTATDLTTIHVDVGEISDASVSLSGGKGDDILVGGSGDDILKGHGGDDQLSGGAGDDVLFGSSGADTLDGGDGADTLFGSSGRDVLRGGEGDDYLDGGSGDDVIDGGAGDDFIKGGRGDDVITGGAGNDRMEGGEGADTFIFDAESGDDIITDILGEDTLVFNGEEFHMDDMILSSNDAGDAVITFGGVDGTSVTLSGVSADSLNTETGDGYTITEDDSGVTIVIDGS